MGLSSDYQLAWPPEYIPGCLGIVGLPTELQQLCSIPQNEKTILIIKATISDHIPLAGEVREIITRKYYNLISIQDEPLTIYLHHGKESAIFYDLEVDNDNRLDKISVEVVAQGVIDAFQCARTAINELLDSGFLGSWRPLVISRLDLYMPNNSAPSAHQILLPFPAKLLLGTLGGMHQNPAFSTIDSLLREAIVSTSPYYRLLCAYRLHEGLRELRHWLKKLAKHYNIQEPLPKDVAIDIDALLKLGFKPDFIGGIKNTNDLYAKLTTIRNRVAHFFLDKKINLPPLHISDGYSYAQYSLNSAVLLSYCFKNYSVLHRYYNDNLQIHLIRGSILPMIEHRSDFRVVSPFIDEKIG